jgi:GNAT superfamily N-acetyltransferase
VGRGIGGQLVSSAVKWFQTKELNRIELSLLAKNETGEIFWKKLGFRVYRLSLFMEISFFLSYGVRSKLFWFK